jgi:hypothetical protein
MVARKKEDSDTPVVSHSEVAAHWVQLISLTTSCYNVGIILMTQLGYRLWAHVKPTEFEDYHRAWWSGWRGIQPLSFPSGIVATLGSLAQLGWRTPRVPVWLVWLNITLQMQSWLLTAVLWAPLQAQLRRARQEDGSLDPLFQRLLVTHWLRVALFTACGAMQFWMAVRSFLSRNR